MTPNEDEPNNGEPNDGEPNDGEPGAEQPRATQSGGENDDRTLRILVELAANGDLSDEETHEVEQLIANKPHLRSEFDRLRSGRHSSPPDTPRASGSSSGCLLGFGGFVFGLIAVLVIGFAVASGTRDGNGTSTGAVSGVISDPNQESLPLEGPTELVELGRLALIYSPVEKAAVLLGDGIPVGGELYRVDRPDTVIAVFGAGSVEILLRDIEPDDAYAVRPAS